MSGIIEKFIECTEIIENRRLLYNIYNQSKTKSYELFIFLEDVIGPKIKYKQYFFERNKVSLENREDVSYTHYFKDNLYKIEKQYSYKWGYLLDELNNYLTNEGYEIDTFYEINGEIKSTLVPMYISEENTCVVNNNLSSDDLLNLLSIKDLNILVVPNFNVISSNYEQRLIISMSISNELKKKICMKVKEQKKLELEVSNIIKTINKECKKVIDDDITYKSKILDIMNGENLRRTITKYTLYNKKDKSVINMSNDIKELYELSKIAKPFKYLYLCVYNYNIIKEANKELRIKEGYRPQNQDKIGLGKDPKINFTMENLMEKEIYIALKKAQEWCNVF